MSALLKCIRHQLTNVHMHLWHTNKASCTGLPLVYVERYPLDSVEQMTQKPASNTLLTRHLPLDWTSPPKESLFPDALQFCVQLDDCQNRSETLYVKITHNITVNSGLKSVATIIITWSFWTRTLCIQANFDTQLGGHSLMCIPPPKPPNLKYPILDPKYKLAVKSKKMSHVISQFCKI